jgi:ZIP family zinc transporter
MRIVLKVRYGDHVVLLLALSTVLSTGLGGIVALRHRDQLHLILGFTAGVLLGLVAFDLLPEVFELGHGRQVAGLPTVAIAFVLGFLLLHVIERSISLHHAHEDEYGTHEHLTGIGIASALALAGHSFLDGVGIGLAFQVDDTLGFAVAFAVIAHDFADGLNTVTLMLRHGNSERRARFMLALDAFAPLLGAASTLVISVPDTVLALYLAFFAGFLLYLATGDILPEAHAHHPSRLTLLATIGGVLFIGTAVALA